MPQTVSRKRREVMRRDFGPTNSMSPCFQEKPRWSQLLGRPYRKPTQVGGEKIPRRLREPGLRNSAK